MIQIIFNIIFLLILTAIIALNINNMTRINLGVHEYENISVVVIVFFSFILGILYALCHIVYSKIRKIGKNKKDLKSKDDKKSPIKDDVEELPMEDPPIPPITGF